jgi:3-hydroxyisobutyrate dehydrogenase-like beta-hydroxyacid dehydrogenase
VTVADSRGTVGIAGVGDMGSAIAGTLLRAGWTVVGYDIDPSRLDRAAAAGVRPAGSLRELAAATAAGSPDAAAIVAIVVDGEEPLDRAAAELTATAPTGSTLVVHTTTRPAHIVALAGAAAERGVCIVDAAVGTGVLAGVRDDRRSPLSPRPGGRRDGGQARQQRPRHRQLRHAA